MWVFFVVDAPGAALGAAALLAFSWVRDSRAALFQMLSIMIVSLGFALGTTALFQAQWIGGLAWQLSLGTGVYVAFALLGAPF